MSPSLAIPGRFNECQIAIEDELIALFVKAELAGWGKDEILAAMIEVAENSALALQKDGLLTVELARFRKRKDV